MTRLKPNTATLIIGVMLLVVVFLTCVSAVPVINVSYPTPSINYGKISGNMSVNYTVTGLQDSITTTNTHGETLSTLNSGATGKMGVKIAMKNPLKISYIGISPNTASATKCYLQNADGSSTLATGSITGTYCSLGNYQTTNGTEYRVVIDAEGGGFDVYGKSSGVSYPYTGSTDLNWTTGINAGAVNINQIWGIQNITTAQEGSTCWIDYAGANNTVICANNTLGKYGINLTSSKSLIFYANDTLGSLNSTTVYWDYGLFEYSQTYNGNTSEGNAESFIFNGTYDNATYQNINAYLYYGGTAYSATATVSGNTLVLSRNVTAPMVTANTNYSFFWSVSVINSTGTLNINTTAVNQLVKNTNVDDCSVYTTLVLNYTMYDERTQSRINGTVYNASIQVDLLVYPYGTSTSPIMNFSQTYSNSSNARVCLENSLVNEQYSMYATVKYQADDYITRYNYLQDFVLNSTNIPQHTGLYALKTTQGTPFLITYKNQQFVVEEGVLINIQRQYLGEGVYKTVDIEQTDYSGQATAYFDLSGAKYNILVTKNGTVQAYFNDTTLYCNYNLVGSCTLNLYAGSTFVPARDFTTYRNINYNSVFTKSTSTLLIDFNTLDSSVSTFNLTAYLNTGYLNTTVCSSQVVTSAGSLSCVIPSTYQNSSVTYYFYKDNEVIESQTIYLNPSSSSFSGISVTLSILLILSTSIMFVPSVIGVLIGLGVGMVLAGIIFLTSGSLMGITSSLIWLGLVIVIIIWKINARGGE